jgi:hypothetical protein
MHFTVKMEYLINGFDLISRGSNSPIYPKYLSKLKKITNHKKICIPKFVQKIIFFLIFAQNVLQFLL